MFKNSKFIKISELYNKIINDFNLDDVYITDFYHPRCVEHVLSIPVKIEVETYESNDDEIIFTWVETDHSYGTSTFLAEYNNVDEAILDSIIDSLNNAYNNYKLINNEVSNLLKNVGKKEYTSKIVMNVLNKRFRDETI